MDTEIICPRCGNAVQLEIEDMEEDSACVDCGTCDASLDVSYTVLVKIENVGIDQVPAVEAECPECGTSLEVEDCPDEEGSKEVECAECNAAFVVKWSSWGQVDDVHLVSKRNFELV